MPSGRLRGSAIQPGPCSSGPRGGKKGPVAGAIRARQLRAAATAVQERCDDGRRVGRVPQEAAVNPGRAHARGAADRQERRTAATSPSAKRARSEADAVVRMAARSGWALRAARFGSAPPGRATARSARTLATALPKASSTSRPSGRCRAARAGAGGAEGGGGAELAQGQAGAGHVYLSSPTSVPGALARHNGVTARRQCSASQRSKGGTAYLTDQAKLLWSRPLPHSQIERPFGGSSKGLP